ncbi:hypothetical protein J6590_015411, partial [Homalodisca vitripennis]
LAATPSKQLESFQHRAVCFLSGTPWFVRHLFDSADFLEWDHIRAWSSREGPAPLHNLRRPRVLMEGRHLI